MQRRGHGCQARPTSSSITPSMRSGRQCDTDFNYVSSAILPRCSSKGLCAGEGLRCLRRAARLRGSSVGAVRRELLRLRYIEKLPHRPAEFPATTADWGLHANGKLADNTVSYAVSVINGNGYRNTTRSKSVDVEGRIGLLPHPGGNDRRRLLPRQARPADRDEDYISGRFWLVTRLRN